MLVVHTVVAVQKGWASHRSYSIPYLPASDLSGPDSNRPQCQLANLETVLQAPPHPYSRVWPGHATVFHKGTSLFCLPYPRKYSIRLRMQDTLSSFLSPPQTGFLISRHSCPRHYNSSKWATASTFYCTLTCEVYRPAIEQQSCGQTSRTGNGDGLANAPTLRPRQYHSQELRVYTQRRGYSRKRAPPKQQCNR